MTHNEIRILIKQITGEDCTKEEALKKMTLAIDKINATPELEATSKTTAIEMIKGLIKTVRFGMELNKSSRENQKKLSDFFKQMAEACEKADKEDEWVRFFNAIAELSMTNGQAKKKW